MNAPEREDRLQQLCDLIEAEGGVWDGKRALVAYHSVGFHCTLERARVNLMMTADRYLGLLVPVEGKRWTYEATTAQPDVGVGETTR